MQPLLNQSVLVLGLGDSGLAMARWCVRCGAHVTVADTRANPPHLAALRAELPQVQFVHGAFDASLLAGAAPSQGQNQDASSSTATKAGIRAVFKSPGLSPEAVAPVWQAAQAAGLWVGTELSLFAHALRELQTHMAYHPKVLGITGTNGKTTVTSLTGRLLERAGVRVAVAGNIGPTLLDTLSQALEQALAQAAQAEAQAQANIEAQAALDAQASIEAQTTPEAQANVAVQAVLQDVADDTPFEVDLPPLVPPPPPPPDHPHLPQVWVLELSSFQLDGVDDFAPTAATVLNLTQDHLDWHGDMANYAAAKARIFGEQGVMVLNREDSSVMAMLPAPVRVKLQKPQLRAHITFGGDLPQRPGDYGIETINGMSWLVRALEADETRKRKNDDEEIHIQRFMPVDALRIRGHHNALNALAALALASSAGGELGPMLFGLRDYAGEPHRVASVAIHNGVEYVDDSKGTNVGATVAALNSLGAERRLVVILGGDGKGQDFAPLLAPITRHARAVVLIGRDAPVLREVLAHSGVVLQDAATLPEAVMLASAQAQSGDVVLLSPACASLDMFDHYAHRAAVFVAAVEQLIQEDGGLA